MSVDPSRQVSREADPTVRWVVWVLVYLGAIQGMLCGLVAVVLFAVW